MQCFQLSVCLCVLCSDDNDTKCSKLLRASLRGTSGLFLIQKCKEYDIRTSVQAFLGNVAKVGLEQKLSTPYSFQCKSNFKNYISVHMSRFIVHV